MLLLVSFKWLLLHAELAWSLKDFVNESRWNCSRWISYNVDVCLSSGHIVKALKAYFCCKYCSDFPAVFATTGATATGIWHRRQI